MRAWIGTIGIAASLSFAPAALAAAPSTYTVSTLQDGKPGTCSAQVGSTESCTTLRAAVDAANANGGDPTISLGAGRYVLGGTGGTDDALEIDQPMTIAGAGSAQTTIAQTDGTYAVLSVTSSGPAQINDVEITGGAASGVYNDGPLTMTGDLVDHNSDHGNDGGPGLEGGAVSGGGILNDGTLTIRQSTITDNTVTGGTGGNETGSANGGGGGLADGGGIFSYGPLTVTDSTISGNIARGGGGGTAVGGTGGGGDVAYGGGVELEGDTVLERDTISANTVIGGAGGSSQTAGKGGSAQAGDGGGINFGGSSAGDTYVLVNVTITGNTATGGRGGSAPGGTEETYGSEGGGISETQLGAATLGNVTLVDNTAGASGYGGNLYAFGGPTETLTIGDSIIAGGSAGTGSNCYGGATHDEGSNVEDSGVGVSQCGLAPATDHLVAPGGDGVATTLGNHGGYTNTLALLAGSPALGAGGACKDPGNGGAALLVDQRGLPRPSAGPCDIGAYQGQTVTAGSVSIADPQGGLTPGGLLLCNSAGFGGDISSYAYQWLLAGKVLARATGSSLLLASSDTGLAVTCRVSCAWRTRVGERREPAGDRGRAGSAGGQVEKGNGLEIRAADPRCSVPTRPGAVRARVEAVGRRAPRREARDGGVLRPGRPYRRAEAEAPGLRTQAGRAQASARRGSRTVLLAPRQST